MKDGQVTKPEWAERKDKGLSALFHVGRPAPMSRLDVQSMNKVTENGHRDEGFCHGEEIVRIPMRSQAGKEEVTNTNTMPVHSNMTRSTSIWTFCMFRRLQSAKTDMLDSPRARALLAELRSLGEDYP